MTVPVGDGGELMSGSSGGLPVLWLSTNAAQFFRRLRRALFRQVFSVECFMSSVFRQAFSVKRFPSNVFLRHGRHFRDGGVFRQQSNFSKVVIVFSLVLLLRSSATL